MSPNKTLNDFFMRRTTSLELYELLIDLVKFNITECFQTSFLVEYARHHRCMHYHIENGLFLETHFAARIFILSYIEISLYIFTPQLIFDCIHINISKKV